MVSEIPHPRHDFVALDPLTLTLCVLFELDLDFTLSSVNSVSQALPNQQTVDWPSFKLVIVGDGGTGNLLIRGF